MDSSHAVLVMDTVGAYARRKHVIAPAEAGCLGRFHSIHDGKMYLSLMLSNPALYCSLTLLLVEWYSKYDTHLYYYRTEELLATKIG